MLTEIKDTEAVIMAAAAGGNAEMDDMLKQFIGSKVSLITQSKLRWEGTLYNIDKTDSSIILQNGELPGLDNEQTDTRWLTFPPLPPLTHTHAHELITLSLHGWGTRALLACPRRAVQPLLRVEGASHSYQ